MQPDTVAWAIAANAQRIFDELSRLPRVDDGMALVEAGEWPRGALLRDFRDKLLEALRLLLYLVAVFGGVRAHRGAALCAHAIGETRAGGFTEQDERHAVPCRKLLGMPDLLAVD